METAVCQLHTAVLSRGHKSVKQRLRAGLSHRSTLKGVRPCCGRAKSWWSFRQGLPWVATCYLWPWKHAH